MLKLKLYKKNYQIKHFLKVQVTSKKNYIKLTLLISFST